MKKNVLILTLFAVGTLVASYAAQEGGGNREAIRERILQKFDKDGDGHLSTEERAELRSFIQSRRGQQSSSGKKSIPEGVGPMPEPEPTLLTDLYGQNAPNVTLLQKDLELRDQERGKTLQFRATYSSDSTGKLPVIVWSHGMYGSQDFYQPLVHHWAKHGYLVLQPTHSDSLRRGSGLSNPTSDWANRPKDVSFLIDSLAQHPLLADRADLTRLGVGGHSYGAHTTMLLGGAVPQIGGQLADSRVKVFVAISPQGEDRLLTSSSWAGLKRPMLFISGDRDQTRKKEPSSVRKAAYLGATPGDKYLLWIKDAYHNFGGISGARHSQSGPANGDQVALVKSTTLAFWDKYLKSDATAAELVDKQAYNQASRGLATWSER